MKKFLFLFLLTTISLVAFSQKKSSRDLYNFNFDKANQKLYWQKVYEIDKRHDIMRMITDMGCNITHKDSTRISGSTPKKNLQMPKGVQRRGQESYEGFNRPVYFEPCTVYFTIDVKDDKYRVTVTNIIFSTQTSFMFMGVIMGVGDMDINSILIRKNGKLRSGAGYVNDFSLLDECLDTIFNPKRNTINVVDKEW